MTPIKAALLSLPLSFFCSCSSTVPTTFESPEAAKIAQTEAAKATGLQASQLVGLSPTQIQTIQSLPAADIAKLRNLKGTALATEMAKLSAPQISKLAAPKVPSVPRLKTPSVPSLPGLGDLTNFDGFTGGKLSSAQALELAKVTGLKAPQLKYLDVPQVAKLQALDASQLAELKDLKGTAFKTKLAELQTPDVPWYKAPFTTQPVYITIENGMTQQQISSELGNPNYKYTIAGEETWVYENANFIMKKIKSTALNMIPVAGPATSLIGSLRQSPAT